MASTEAAGSIGCLGAPAGEGAAPPVEEVDLVTALHDKVDELALNMFESVRNLPTEPRNGALPHATLSAHAASLVRVSREFDALVDTLADAWPQTADEQLELLSEARAAHDAAGEGLLRANDELVEVRDAIREARDTLLASTAGRQKCADPCAEPTARARLEGLRALAASSITIMSDDDP